MFQHRHPAPHPVRGRPSHRQNGTLHYEECGPKPPAPKGKDQSSYNWVLLGPVTNGSLFPCAVSLLTAMV